MTAYLAQISGLANKYSVEKDTIVPDAYQAD